MLAANLPAYLFVAFCPPTHCFLAAVRVWLASRHFCFLFMLLFFASIASMVGVPSLSLLHCVSLFAFRTALQMSTSPRNCCCLFFSAPVRSIASVYGFTCNRSGCNVDGNEVASSHQASCSASLFLYCSCLHHILRHVADSIWSGFALRGLPKWSRLMLRLSA